MAPLKLRIMNQFGTAQAINSPDEIEAVFPYETDTLVKKMSFGNIKIINGAKGEIEVELTPFDIQGMSVGNGQSFVVKIKTDGKTKTALFERVLNIKSEFIDGQDRKVLVK